MKILKILLSAFFLIGLLTYSCFLVNVDRIKKTFLLIAQDAYLKHNMLRVNVGIKGDDLKTTRILILTGTVLSEDLKEKAHLIALSIDGVTDVENNLKIQNRDKGFNFKRLKPKNRKIKSHLR